MKEEQGDPQYQQWLSGLKEGDEVAMVGKFGLETGGVRSASKVFPEDGSRFLMVNSKTRGSCNYSFFDNDGINPYHGIRLVPLTEERKVEAARMKEHNLKAAQISCTNWQLQEDGLIDAVLETMGNYGKKDTESVPAES